MNTATAANETKAASEQCPKCHGTTSRVIRSVILGDECSECRIARQGRAGEGQPGHGLRGEAAVEARRAASEVAS